MAQVAGAPVPVGTDGTPLTAEDLREILEYEKIVQFRDAVLAGIHPRVKIPSHLIGKQTNRNTSSPSLSTPHTNPPSQSTTWAPGTYHDNNSPYRNNKSPSNYRTPGGHVQMASKSEINPILLEKSDDLIRAELQLQRQRLERALREQIEQQRLAKMALDKTSESLPNFDLTEVLSEALAIVHPVTAARVEALIDASASDSFDERTFYSSQHDSPTPSSSPQSQKGVVEARSHDLAAVKQPTEFITSQNQVDQDVVMTGVSLSKDNYAQAHSKVQKAPYQQSRTSQLGEQPLQVGKSLSNGTDYYQNGPRGQNQEKHNTATAPNQPSSRDSIGMGSRKAVDQRTPQNAVSHIFQRENGDKPDSPVIRAHNLSPVAPQPARVSPLATAREPPILRSEFPPTDEAQPAQVAALRTKASGYSSTDSSPKGVKDSGKKKNKKEKRKKRKASSNENAADTPESPYIKPEPRSPSPFAVAPLPRPQKRQRQMGHFAAELNYDEPRYGPIEEAQQRGPERRELGATRTYDRPEARYEVGPRRPEPVYRRIARDDGDYHRISSGHYARRPESPSYAPIYPEDNDARPIRAVGDRKLHEQPIYYREPIPRAIVRPEADRERSRSPVIRERRSSPAPMGPPRRPVRIIVDEYGREYIDPTPISSMPPPRYRDSEVVYERAPMRSVSVRAPAEQYEEDGIIYRRPSPPSVTPRRVVTQPEYASDYRAYRQREYSARPMAPPGEEYVQMRAPERRPVSQYEEAPREYAPRAASVRPEPVRYEEPPREYIRAPTARPEAIRYDEAPREYIRAATARPEPVRYELPREYRLQSVRPEPPLREHNASVRPEARREMAREFSVRSGEIPQPHDHERYYDERNGPSRNPGEIAFIERPRGGREASVMVYTDDVRREMYR
jgi:hypothetical protein